MTLIDDVQGVCRRLAPQGWADLLAQHGLDITVSSLAEELARRLPGIRRDLPGFEDFAMEGRRGIEPGRPARSLLYHALASPSVVTGAGDQPLGAFPTLAEIEAVENYVFGVEPPSVDDLVVRFPHAVIAIAVFATECRPGAETVHRRHADLCFSRTGVARVGTAEPLYDPRARGFVPFDEEDQRAFRVLPARYAPYIAFELKGDESLFGPMNFDLLDRVPEEVLTQILPWVSEVRRSDRVRDFWVPIHKLFPGPECVRGLDLTVALEAHHVNEKIRRVHLELQRLGHDTNRPVTDLERPPFVFTEDIAEFSRDPDGGEGLLTPVVHERLIEPAEFEGEPLSFPVPSEAFLQSKNPRQREDWSPSLLISPTQSGARRSPEYVHVRHEVKADGTIADLNDVADVATRVRRGGYDALHYVDFTGDGWVAARCPQLAVSIPRSVPAYSLVTAIDFYPNCDQRELIEWWIQRVPTALRDSVWRVPPLTLSDGRIAPNLKLRARGAAFRPKDDTVTAIVSLPTDRDEAQLPLDGAPNTRHAHLPDAAASVFAPGWDTGRDETEGTRHLASYGLGSPFPEDAKLCAALSSFWPAVAPDAGRSFSRAFPTATPLTDAEIGSVGQLPWDGVPGPRLIPGGDGGRVEYASFDHVDYVNSALDAGFSLSLTGQVDTAEYTARILAVARTNVVLAVVAPEMLRWRMTSFQPVIAGDQDLARAEEETGVPLLGEARYRITLGSPEAERRRPADHRIVEVEIGEVATLFVGALPQVLIKREGAAWRAVETP
jgi:hypothetical protein